MHLVLIIGLIVMALACVLTGAMASQLQSSDPAGNGLAQAYFVFALALIWLLVGTLLVVVFVRPPVIIPPEPPSRPAMGAVVATLFLIAVVGQCLGMRWLFDAANKGTWRQLSCLAAAVVPLAFVVFAAWRGAGLPVPAVFATWGCAFIVVVGSLVPMGPRVLSALKATGPKVNTQVTFPALLLNGEHAVRVLRYAEELEQVRTGPAEPFAELLLVDANRTTYVLDPSGVSVTLVRDTEPIDLDLLCARLLRIPRLDPDPAKDAEVRKLIALQRDVSALSFVLPR